MNNKVVSIHCSRCLHVNRHFVLFTKDTDCADDVDGLGHTIASSGYSWTLYECCGCENVVLRRRFWHTDMEAGESHEEECYNTWYPPLIGRNIPKWHRNLGDTEQRLIREIYVALHAEALSLALMGLRTLLDVYIVKKVGDVGSFKFKLDKLVTLGFLSAAQREQIEPAIEAGSAAAYRGYNPSLETVTFVLDVVEVLLHQDILGPEASHVGADVPPRQKR